MVASLPIAPEVEKRNALPISWLAHGYEREQKEVLKCIRVKNLTSIYASWLFDQNPLALMSALASASVLAAR